MNEHLPYEDELRKRLNDLQLPNEDAAWEDMKRRLDKDDEDKPMIPPVLKGCGGYGIILLLIAIVLLLVVDPASCFHSGTKKPHVKTDSIEIKMQPDKNGKDNREPVPGNDTTHEILLKDTTALSQKGITHSTLLNDSSVDKNEILKRRSSNRGTDKIQNGYSGTNKQNAKTFNQQNNKVSTKKTHQYNHPVKKIKGAVQATVADNTEADSVINDNKNTEHTKTYQPDKTENDTANIVIKAKIDLDSMKKKEVHITTRDNKAKTDSLKQKNIYFGAGLAIHQLLPVAGQKSNPYNSLGRKSSLGDYIPSVYVRLYKDKKWFLQSEFRYGAPQYSKEIVYILKKIIDTSASSITSESKRLKKTFYHQ